MSDRPPRIRRARPNLIGRDELMGWTERIVEITEQHEEFRRVGTSGDAATRGWIVDEYAWHGVTAVDETFEVETRYCCDWSLTVSGEVVPSYFMNGAAFTGDDGVSGEFVYVGDSLGSDVDVADKVVVMDLQCGPVLPGSAVAAVADYSYDPDGVMAAGTFGGQGGPAARNLPGALLRSCRARCGGVRRDLPRSGCRRRPVLRRPDRPCAPPDPRRLPQGFGRRGARRPRGA